MRRILLCIVLKTKPKPEDDFCSVLKNACSKDIHYQLDQLTGIKTTKLTEKTNRTLHVPTTREGNVDKRKLYT